MGWVNIYSIQGSLQGLSLVATDKEKEQKELKKIIAKRALASRRAAGLTSDAAAKLIGHKNSTQLSLIESAERLPSLPTIIALSRVYAVPIDFLTGSTDDPIAEPLETNQGVIANAVSQSIASCLSSFQERVSQYTAMAVMNHSRDRIELLDLCAVASRAIEAQLRIRELNPDYDEDIRAGSKLDKELNTLTNMISIIEARMKHEEMAKQIVNEEIGQQDIFSKALSQTEQFVFDFINR
jgi:transcriptional regulator with XRE-family HTH domain